MKRVAIVAAAVLALAAVYVQVAHVVSPAICVAGEIGFSEDFALSGDRTKALEQLIPGTEEYYFYHCLHHQNTGRLDEVEKLLKVWIERHGRTGRVVEVENRQALLGYPAQPGESLEFIRSRLNIHFNHQREVMGEKPKLPTSLDEGLITREAYTRLALARHRGTTDGFEDRALDWLVVEQLDADRRRHLLGRLRRPDYPGLPQVVMADLKYKNSRGFGSMEIHKLLLLEQLGECLRMEPGLLNQTNFVNVYLSKLWPDSDTDWRNDTKAREAYLERLWSFVARLNPSHNSLKAHVLYHRLAHDRALGVYDRGRFMTYLKLPRNVGYVSRDYLKRDEHRRFVANLGANYQGVTQLPAVGNDEPLVRSYLEHWFGTEESYSAYATYLNDIYLKHLFAEVKIVGGLGDMEKWYSMLPPEQYQALKERVDLDFAYTNKTVFGVEEQVSLDLHSKGVKKLIVKVFEINALNYYRENLRELDTAIDLDGLVANEEETHEYEEPALRRVKRHFEFPSLSKRGTYVVEFIGGGKSSRALVRKGKLWYLVRTSVAGHVFTVLEESNRKLKDASLWQGGRKYEPQEDGTITVPFSNQPGRQPVILVHGGFASLDHFTHESEGYRLTAGIHVEREALLERSKARVVVRPFLTLNGVPVTLSVLEEPTLVITSTDREGVSTTKEVGEFKLEEDEESTYEFQVPSKLSAIRFELKAKVENLSQAKKVDLRVARSFTLNEIDKTERIEDLHLGHAGGKYFLEVLGKTGEAKADRPVHFWLKHRDFRDVVDVVLQSDAKGRVSLGALEGIEWVRGKGPEETQHQWALLEDLHTYPGSLHGRVGSKLYVPYMGSAKKPERSELSLLEMRGGTYVRDRFGSLSIASGYVVIDDLPQGDYDLWLKDVGARMRVRLTAGEESEGHVLSGYRQLELRNRRPLQISSVEAGGGSVRVKLEGAGKYTRVHVVGTRYLPEYPVWGSLDVVSFPDPYVITMPAVESQYVVERDIGDEYRYILERKYAKIYPGNLLTRPSLLLNPWAIRSTETGVQDAKGGEAFDRLASGAAPGRGRAASKRPGAPPQLAGGFANLDFLGEPAVVLLNLEPDEKGVVTVALEDLGAHHHLHVLAASPEDTVYREMTLAEAAMKFKDLRLRDGLSPQEHFTEKKEISIVGKDKPLVLQDITTSSFETYDTLGKVYSLLVTLSGNSTLVEFGFVLRWPELKLEEKQEKYTKYACHELNFFLYEKDPEFFREVVKPLLVNKYHKTFLDRWLIEDDLGEYLEPWAFAQLNIVERILLARRIVAEQPAMARHVKDLFDLIPPNIEHQNHLFKTALKGRALEADDALGVDAARDHAVVLKEEAKSVRAQSRTTRARRSLAAEAAPPAPAAEPAAAEVADMDALSLESLSEGVEEFDTADRAFFAADKARRKSVRQLYRKLEKTKEWVENNYYHLPIERQNAGLITVNGFWKDFAAHDGKSAFFSESVAEASRNFPEMMLALAVLDLPFESGKHETEAEGLSFTLKAGSPAIVFHKEIKTAHAGDEKTPILVTQNFYRHGDRYIHVNNERRDKYITEEFLVHVVYGCHVVITNPTSSPQKLDVLIQVPEGALPVMNGQYTRSVHVALEPYRTWTADYFFYFPAAGTAPHFPVHVARNEELVAYAEPKPLKVVEIPSVVDQTSWDYISQNGTPEQVISFLEENNLGRIKLDRIAWRMRDRAFFNQVLKLLHSRHIYEHTLWSYGIHHNTVAAAREYLKHSGGFVGQCGAAIETELLVIDPVERKSYQHMEYWPLVNARAHRLGKARQILNNRFHEQYMRLLRVLSYRPELDDDDLMSVTYYLLLQDRVEESLGFFDQVKPRKLAAKLQYDYFESYLGMYTENLRSSRETAEKYAKYPVDRWRNLFANVVSQLDEIEGKSGAVVDEEDRTQVQTRLAATEPSFDFEVESGKVQLSYQNLSECRVNYYLMDIELLFSRNPFVGQYSGQFAYIRPNATDVVKLGGKSAKKTFALPDRFLSSNVLVEIVGAGEKKSRTYFSNAMVVQVVEGYAQAQVTDAKTRKSLPKVYVKVYARMKGGAVRFYKDGYTDLRGRFDYGSLSTNELDQVERFAILFLSKEHGAMVREAAPPKR